MCSQVFFNHWNYLAKKYYLLHKKAFNAANFQLLHPAIVCISSRQLWLSTMACAKYNSSGIQCDLYEALLYQ